ncbi:hypothetical protein ACQ4WP_18055 [Janthinobacterium sp. GB4P2]
MANMKIGTRLRCSFALLTLLLMSEPQQLEQERAAIARAGGATEKGLS